MKPFLYVQKAYSKDPARQKEYDDTLARNKKSGLFEHVFCVDTGELRRSFAQIFEHINLCVPSGATVVLANSDIIFDESIRLAENMLPFSCYALARWQDGKRYGNAMTQDTWIFRAPVVPIPDAIYPLGVPGCDHRIAQQLRDAGYDVRNPAESIRTWHNHATQARTYTQADRVQGAYAEVKPDWINLVSFSLFGTDPKYLHGAVANAYSVPQKYPGWRAAFYVGADVPENTVAALERHGALVRKGTVANPYLYRLEALREPNIARVLFRDADSRISDREVQAVRDWVGSKLPFHTIHDHPNHRNPILMGMWGVLSWEFPHIENVLTIPAKGKHYGSDEEFLAQWIYPIIKPRIFASDFRTNLPASGEDFIGERFNERDQPETHGRKVRNDFLRTLVIPKQ